MTRVALVTGAARGIGAATTRALCARGDRVVALDVCSGEDAPPGVDYCLAAGDDLAGVAAQFPRQVLPVEADVRDLDALRAAVDHAVDRWGRLDLAIAAAGVVAGGGPLWETPADHLCTLLDVNTIGVWNTAAAVLPVMLASPDPSTCRFVAVASAAGERGLFHLAGYTASKHAVIGIIRGLAADLRGTGVTAVAVSPGSTDTEMLDATAALYGTTPDDLVRHQAIGRVITPEEIASAIVWACAPEGAVLNGSVINADGGFSG